MFDKLLWKVRKLLSFPQHFFKNGKLKESFDKKILDCMLGFFYGIFKSW